MGEGRKEEREREAKTYMTLERNCGKKRDREWVELVS